MILNYKFIKIIKYIKLKVVVSKQVIIIFVDKLCVMISKYDGKINSQDGNCIRTFNKNSLG